MSRYGIELKKKSIFLFQCPFKDTTAVAVLLHIKTNVQLLRILPQWLYPFDSSKTSHNGLFFLPGGRRCVTNISNTHTHTHTHNTQTYHITFIITLVVIKLYSLKKSDNGREVFLKEGHGMKVSKYSLFLLYAQAFTQYIFILPRPGAFDLSSPLLKPLSSNLPINSYRMERF